MQTNCHDNNIIHAAERQHRIVVRYEHCLISRREATVWHSSACLVFLYLVNTPLYVSLVALALFLHKIDCCIMIIPYVLVDNTKTCSFNMHHVFCTNERTLISSSREDQNREVGRGMAMANKLVEGWQWQIKMLERLSEFYKQYTHILWYDSVWHTSSHLIISRPAAAASTSNPLSMPNLQPTFHVQLKLKGRRS